MKIAGNLTIKDWKELCEVLDNSMNDNWGNAVNFFAERIKTRYLNPIDEILRMKDFIGEGFAIVTLQCSLIETVECFINGWKYKENNKSLGVKQGWYLNNNERNEDIMNEDIFKRFFENRSEVKGKIKGDEFYKYVRCSLLHETQSARNWKIKRNDSRSELDWYQYEDEFQIIYPYQLNNTIKSLVDRYRKALVNGMQFDEIENTDLRDNFKEKMNHICFKSI